MKMAKAGFIVGSLVGILVVVCLVSLALSVVVCIKQDNADEAFIAACCSVGAVAISFFTVICITSPAACISYNTTDRSCCMPTSYVSVAVAGSITVIGMFIAGILQVFSISNYKENVYDNEVSSITRASAALSLFAAAFGVVLIVATVSTYCKRQEEESYCSMQGVVGLVLANIFLISCLVAALLTFICFFYFSYYAEDHEDAASTMPFYAAMFSGVTAGWLMLASALSPLIFIYGVRRDQKNRALGAALLLWGLAFGGMIIAGALMMKVGEKFSSEVLNTDLQLNRNSISTMAYLIGGLNFISAMIAFFYCCTGVFCCKKTSTTSYHNNFMYTLIVIKYYLIN